MKVAITEKESDDGEDNPVKYLATNTIDASTAHTIRLYAMLWLIKTFFEFPKQNLRWGDCELQTDEGATGIF